MRSAGGLRVQHSLEALAGQLPYARREPLGVDDAAARVARRAQHLPEVRAQRARGRHAVVCAAAAAHPMVVLLAAAAHTQRQPPARHRVEPQVRLRYLLRVTSTATGTAT